MRLSRLSGLALAAVIVPAACRESTGPSQPSPPAAISWIEWTAAVAKGQAESLRVSGGVPCSYGVVWGVTVSGSEVLVTGRVYDRNVPCLDNGTGAGSDTVFALTGLAPKPYAVAAPMLDLVSSDPIERVVGSFDVGTTPDTTPEFAGIAAVTVDSAGCWRAQPAGALPLALSSPPALTSTSGWQAWSAFLIGRLVVGSPAACGDARSVSASTLVVYVALY